MAAAGGVLAVPSFSAAQAWAPVDKRARVVAAINVLNAAFMVTGTVAVAILQAAGLDLAGVFALLALTCWAFRTVDVQEFAEGSPARRLTDLTAPRTAPVRRHPESHPEN